MKSNKAIIVKKVKKHGGGGHHGGMWKVAYADFVTAMMAFFLLLWLLSMVSEEQRARISAYFKYFSLYDSGGTSWMEKSSEIFGESGENTQKAFSGMYDPALNQQDSDTLNSIEESIKKDIAEKLGDIKDQVIVDVVDEGIRIQMTDKDGSLMFERGSTQLTPKAKEVLKVISGNINNLHNNITIEGHTDALPFAGSKYSNWELSTERASSARIELEADGLDSKRIIRVAGYADTDPLVKENPHDPRNRRISIILNTPGKKTANPSVLKGEEKQLKEISRELVSEIEKAQIPADKEKPVNSNNDRNHSVQKSGENNPVKKYEWPPFRPIEKQEPRISEEKKEPVIKKYDVDSIIKEGQSGQNNGNAGRKVTDKKDGNTPVITDNVNKPNVIKELSAPVIKDKIFPVITDEK